jgi:hypothetical protein
MRKATQDWRLKNPTWDKEYESKRRIENPGHMKILDRKRNLARYGITEDRYEEMFNAQNGVCAICKGINRSGRRLSIDHDHKTGEVRGLLCSQCNSAIGLARESLDILRKAVIYLEKHEKMMAV